MSFDNLMKRLPHSALVELVMRSLAALPDEMPAYLEESAGADSSAAPLSATRAPRGVLGSSEKMRATGKRK